MRAAVGAPSVGTATIQNSDPLPGASVARRGSVTEGSVAYFSVGLTERSGYPVTLGFTTRDGTATAGRNYDSSAGTLTIPAGQTGATIPIQTIDDHVYEPSEGFSLDLNSATCAALGETAATGTILNIDPPPGVSVGTAGSVTEGSVATFPVWLTASSGYTTTIGYATENGTASAPLNYSAASGEVTIPAGQTSASIPVQTVDDGIYEPNETFSMTLTSAINASLASPTAAATIIDIDPAVNVSVGTAGSVGEGSVATFPIWLSNAAARDVTLSYTTENGTASAPLNYTAASGEVTIPAGDLTTSIPVETVDDHINEPNETFSLALTSATNATLAATSASATILNTDPPLHVNIETPSAVLEGDTVTFSLTLCDPSGQPASCGADVTASYHTVDGTADGGSAGSTSADYVSAASGTTVVIPAGSTSAEITVATMADDINEPDEGFSVCLDGATHASTSGTATASLTTISASLESLQFTSEYKDADGNNGVYVGGTYGNPGTEPNPPNPDWPTPFGCRSFAQVMGTWVTVAATIDVNQPGVLVHPVGRRHERDGRYVHVFLGRRPDLDGGADDHHARRGGCAAELRCRPVAGYSVEHPALQFRL